MLIFPIPCDEFDFYEHKLGGLTIEQWRYRGFMYFQCFMIIQGDGLLYMLSRGQLRKVAYGYDITAMLEPAAKAWAQGDGGLTAFEYLSAVFG